MPTTDTYSVSYITHTMRGAPVINGNTPGCLIAVLDAVLVNGWGLAAPTSVTVAGGIATATFASATPWQEGAVIEISGGTPVAINGKARVLTSSSTMLTWATSAGDGSYSGAMGIKYAPAGWEKVYSGTSKAAYRATDITASKKFFRIDDSAGDYASVNGFHSMNGIDATADPFLPNGGYFIKSINNNPDATPFLIAADSKFFVVATSIGYSSYSEWSASVVRGFGDCIPFDIAGDNPVLLSADCGKYGSTAYGGFSGAPNGSDFQNGALIFSKKWIGIGGSILGISFPESGSAAALSGGDGLFGDGPSVIDGEIKLSRMLAKENQGGSPPRAVIPACYFAPQKISNSMFGVPFEINKAKNGKMLCTIPVGSIYNSRSGTAFVDVTGPWR